MKFIPQAAVLGAADGAEVYEKDWLGCEFCLKFRKD
jgi:hypothetical protein